MKIKTNTLLISVTATILMSGCIGGPSPEEIQQQQEAKKMFMQMMAQRLGQNVEQTPPTQTNVAPMHTISEEELKNSVANFDKLSTGVKIEKYKNGFSINQKRYIDPEGKIVNYGFDWQTGDITYMIGTSENHYIIKFMRALASQSPVEIATVVRDGNTFKAQTVSGKKFNSNGLVLTSQGFIALRDDTAFQYTIGKDIESFSSPEGWHIADFQNGDVASTNFILLEKNAVDKNDENSISGLIDSTTSLMNSVGLTDKKDYMLVNIANPQEKYLLDIDMNAKDVGTYSGCKRVNSFVNKCDNVSFSESLYDNNGMPNVGHYYWRVMWYRTANGKILSISKEAGHKKILITDLISGKQAEAAYRLTGFPELTSTQNSDGKIKIIVGGGLLSDIVIEDAETYLKEHPLEANTQS